MSEPIAMDVLDRITTAERKLLTEVDVANVAGDAAEVAEAGGLTEPIYDEAARLDIQGNIVPGFNKDHQHFLFLRIHDRERARRWVAEIASSITSMDEALRFVREYRARRLAEGVREPAGLTATWVNIAFSHPGISA
jgi:hypothetical protein